MREARELLARVRELRHTNRPAVIATIVAVEGSAYRREGARLLLEPDGAMTGVLSGGCVERELLPPAREVLASGQPRTLRFDLSADEEAIWGFGLGCSGAITLLLEPLASAGAVLERALAEAIEARRTVRLTTRVRATTAPEPGASRVTIDRRLEVLETDSRKTTARLFSEKAKTFIEGKGIESPSAALEPSGATPGPELRLQWKSLSGPAEAPISGRPRRGEEVVEETRQEIELVETMVPPVHLVVVGAERDVTPLVRLAAELGWQATVVDARPTAAAEARVAPFARYVGAAPRRLADVVTFDARTAVLVATHRYLDDLAYLGELERAELGYLGLLGPAQRRERLLADLTRRRGGAASPRTPLRGPAGLDLGGRSPGEIALAIVAEVQAELHAGSGRPLAEKPERASREPAERSP
jgi:xanthine dehydrogenase accessory factor